MSFANSSSPKNAPESQDSRLLIRFATLIEIAVVIGISSAAVLWVQPFISPGLGETLGLMDGSAPDFIASSIAMLKGFGVQYGAILILVVSLALLQRGRPRRAFALTRGGHSTRSLVLLGLVAGFIASIPAEFVFVSRELWSIDSGTMFWVIMDKVSWWDWNLWIFFGVAGYAVVPIVEEFTWRGYMLGRLVENFGPGGAILVTTLLFTALHGQYFIDPDIGKSIAIFALLFAAPIFGLITLRTGSILPAVIAHAMINIPSNLFFAAGRIAIGVVLIYVFRKQIGDYLKVLKEWLIDRDVLVALGLLIGFGGLAWLVSLMGDLRVIAFGAAAVIVIVASRLSHVRWGVD